MAKLALKFRIFKNNELVAFRELSQPVIKIGKVPTAHLALEDDSVSRMHAIIEVSDLGAHLIDLGSTRGTFVNGQKINKAKLTDGDEIRIGDIRLELAIGEASAPTIIVEKQAPPPLPITAPAILPPAPAMMVADAMRGDEPGARAVEVAAMLGDSVVDVKHCMDPRSGKVTPMTWGFLAGGLACLLTSATAFYVSVDAAATNKASLDYHINVLKKPAYSHRPKQVGAGVDYAAFGGLALGLLAMTAGLARARGEKRSPYYRIGTAPGVQQPALHAPTADFAMVAPSGDDFVFNYGAGMDGELIVDGKSTPLAQVATARPSAAIAGAIEIPIPAHAKIRARAGQTTFVVSSVAKPATHATPLFNMERRTAAYVAGSLAIHLGVIAFLQTIPPDDAGVSVLFSTDEPIAIASNNAQPDEVPPEQEELQNDGAAGETSAGGRMALEEGAAGKPDAANDDGHMRIKDRGEVKQLSREQAIEEAMNAGVMGSFRQLSGGIAAITGEAAISSGFDGTDVYGPLFGGEGEGRGSWGMGRYGMSSGGGCLGGDCGLVGAGRYGTIGTGDRVGDNGWGQGGRGKGGWRHREASVPTVNIPAPSLVSDGLDRAIIKRYVKRQLAQISYCYESELLVKPSLEGTVTVQFLITSAGTVSQSTGAGLDPKVSNCVANVVKNIAFPKPSNGGNVQVNYPFNFRAAGH